MESNTRKDKLSLKREQIKKKRSEARAHYLEELLRKKAYNTQRTLKKLSDSTSIPLKENIFFHETSVENSKNSRSSLRKRQSKTAIADSNKTLKLIENKESRNKTAAVDICFEAASTSILDNDQNNTVLEKRISLTDSSQDDMASSECLNNNLNYEHLISKMTKTIRFQKAREQKLRRMIKKHDVSIKAKDRIIRKWKAKYQRLLAKSTVKDKLLENVNKQIECNGPAEV